jgi:ATP-dependent Lon protease
MSQSYLELMLSLPWNKSSEDKADLEIARTILNDDHSGLEKVKKRIIEFLAVRALNKKARGSILCFYGPPGVGKTSLGNSIAKALGRKYQRLSIGGIRDESVLRGHRKTYVGAYPGMIIQAIRRAGTNNPVILLDEIDKIGDKGFHGDPAAALLEILDPNQNSKFMDHYVNVPFDLSNVLFIATANSLETMSRPLKDRMEIITIEGYTAKEKLDIAEKYLLKKSLLENGLPDDSIVLSSPVISKIIKDYTKEAGVRELERKISSVCRSIAVEYLGFTNNNQDEKKAFNSVSITEGRLSKILGPPKFNDLLGEKLRQPGTALGLAWTEVGGKVLIVETSYSRGKGLVSKGNNYFFDRIYRSI